MLLIYELVIEILGLMEEWKWERNDTNLFLQNFSDPVRLISETRQALL